MKRIDFMIDGRFLEKIEKERHELGITRSEYIRQILLEKILNDQSKQA